MRKASKPEAFQPVRAKSDIDETPFSTEPVEPGYDESPGQYPKMLTGPDGEQPIVPDALAEKKMRDSWKARGSRRG